MKRSSAGAIPGGEIHSPFAFIGLATELGLIDPITLFVLAEAIQSIDLLDEAFGAGKAIAINVAAKQAGDLQFMRSFVHALEASGCADRFILEVTEDAFTAPGLRSSLIRACTTCGRLRTQGMD